MYIKNDQAIITNSAIEFVEWSVFSANNAFGYQESKLAEKILAFQTTRIAPIKQFSDNHLAYHSFNLGLHVGDCPTKVENNRQYLQQLLPEQASIQWFEQVHGNQVAKISQVCANVIVADAAVTREKNTCLAIMTADCLPILLTSKSGDEIAAIHGGWKPLAANIIANTLDVMHTPNSDIIAWLGPCISQTAFEVGDEVKAIFIDQNEDIKSAFIPATKGKHFADLHKIARLQLESLGVEYISALSECTYTNNEKYYSYRKSSVTGRMATLICIR